MLFNPQWKDWPVTRTAPTLDEFIAWLETKNPDETYRYFDPKVCAVGQFHASMHGEQDWSYVSVFPTIEDYHYVCAGFNDDTIRPGEALNIAILTPTFGETLKRAKEVAAREKASITSKRVMPAERSVIDEKPSVSETPNLPAYEPAA